MRDAQAFSILHVISP